MIKNPSAEVTKHKSPEKMIADMYARHERLLENPAAPDYESTETGSDLISKGISFHLFEFEKQYVNMTIEQMKHKISELELEQDKINKIISSIMENSMRIQNDKIHTICSIVSFILLAFGGVAILNTLSGNHAIENQYMLIGGIIGIFLGIWVHTREKRNANFIRQNDELIENERMRFDLINREIDHINFSIERRLDARIIKSPAELAKMADYIRTHFHETP